MVDVKQLIASIKRVAWRQGNVTGSVTHEPQADGSHRIIVTVPAGIATWEAPVTVTPRTFQGTEWNDLVPPTRPKRG